MMEPAPMTEEKVKGPASYFPSIEKKYGRPIAEWQDLIRARLPAKYGPGRDAEDRSRPGPRPRQRACCVYAAGRKGKLDGLPLLPRRARMRGTPL